MKKGLFAKFWTASFILHLAIVLIFINQTIALDDMFQYDMLARSLSEGNGYRWYGVADVAILKPYMSQFIDLDTLQFPQNGLLTAYRAPGYPFFLAGLYLLVPTAWHWGLARVVQAGLMALLAPLASALALLLGFNRKTALVAGVLTGLYPILLFYPSGLASEDLYIVLAMALLVLLLVAARKRSLGWTVLAGLAGGLLVLTRANYAAVVVLGGAWLGWQHPAGKKAGLLLAGVAFGLCLPWCVRNSIVMGQPAFVENSLGYNLFIGYHPDGNGGFISSIASQPLTILDDAERDTDCMEQALGFIAQDPLEAVRRVFARTVFLLGPEDREFSYFYSNNLVGSIGQPWLALLYLLLIVPWTGALFFGILGLWTMKDRKSALLLAALLVGYCLPVLLIIAEPRFHLALAPVLVPLAVYGWGQRGNLRPGRLFRRKNLVLLGLLLAVAVILAISLAGNWGTLVQLMAPGGNELKLYY